EIDVVRVHPHNRAAARSALRYSTPPVREMIRIHTEIRVHASGDEQYAAEFASCEDVIHVAVYWKEPELVVHGVHATRRMCRFRHGDNLAHRRSQWLFADHVLARFERRDGLLSMEFRGRRDVDYIDSGCQELTVVIERCWNVMLLRSVVTSLPIGAVERCH